MHMTSLPLVSILALLVASGVHAQDKPLEGITLNVASQNDQFAGPLRQISQRFKDETGATVSVDVLSYPELLTKVTADFVGNTLASDFTATFTTN